jgi:integrase
MKRFKFAPSRQDVEAMQKATEEPHEKLVIRLGAYCGLRECEIVGDSRHPGLRVEDVDFERKQLMIYGKGWATGKVSPEEIPVDSQTLAAIKDLMKKREITSGKLVDYSTRWVRVLVKRLAIKAAITHSKECHPHCLRRFFVTEIIRLRNPSYAQRLARHRDVGTTTRYYEKLNKDELDQAYREAFDS